MDSPVVAAYQPPLTRWSHAWRYAVVLLVGAATWGSVFADEWERHRALWWSDLALGLVALGALHLRRRFPVAVAVLTNLLSIVSGLAAASSILASVSLATRRKWRELVPTSVLGIVCGSLFTVVQPSAAEPWWTTLTSNVIAMAAIVAVGMYVGSRRELVWTLRDRAVRAETEQASRVEQARVAERTRIAREMHDVLAHRISLVSLHAGALAFRQDLGPEESRRTAEVIQTNAHDALVELRGVLGVLRSEEERTGADPRSRPAAPPQPTLADLDQLIADSRAAGVRVAYADRLPADAPLPASAGRTVYRIVQEALTNARKHAPDALVRLDLSGSPASGVDVLVTNPLRVGRGAGVPGSGLGLVGLAERTALAGGTLTHDVRPDDTFELRAWVPWPA